MVMVQEDQEVSRKEWEVRSMKQGSVEPKKRAREESSKKEAEHLSMCYDYVQRREPKGGRIREGGMR